jgi:hypothetical protein
MVTPGVLVLERRQDITVIKAVARAFRWRRMLESGRFGTINELASAEKINSSYVSRLLRLTPLAPDIVEAILDGRQPEGMTLPALLGAFPLEWARQEGGPRAAKFAIRRRMRSGWPCSCTAPYRPYGTNTASRAAAGPGALN